MYLEAGRKGRLIYDGGGRKTSGDASCHQLIGKVNTQKLKYNACELLCQLIRTFSKVLEDEFI